MPGGRKKRDREETYWEIELTPGLRLALLEILRGNKKGKITQATSKLIENQVLAAREVDMPLPVGGLDWSDLEDEAARQGVGVLDILFDVAHGGRAAE